MEFTTLIWKTLFQGSRSKQLQDYFVNGKINENIKQLQT